MRKFPMIMGLILGAVIISLIWVSGNTWLSIQALHATHLELSSQAAGRAWPVMALFSLITFHQVPDLEVGRLGLQLLETATSDVTLIAQSVEPVNAATNPSLKSILSPKFDQLQQISQLLPRTMIVKQFLSANQETELQLLGQILPIIKQTVLSGDQIWVLLFQNSQELRATGGFMGSLAFVTLHDGSITKIDIQDIYQPDGQFTGSIPAPIGVNEYLSSGKGWRLPDMNWSPDYPISAQQTISFLDQVGYHNIQGVIAINLSLAEKILAVVGDVNLPDYQTTVTANNVASVLRQNRDEFFPGSIAKQHLLASFFTQFKLKLLQTDLATQLKLLPIIKTALATKELQLYSTDSKLEKIIADQKWAGFLPSTQGIDFYLFPVESNVGINKANQGVERSWDLNVEPTQTTLKITFFNTNQKPLLGSEVLASPSAAQATHLHYVNYQRFLVTPTTSIKQIVFENQPIPTWDEEIITTSSGETLKQIGFLVNVSEQSTNMLTVAFNHPALTNNSKIALGKQAGISPIKVKLNVFGNVSEVTLAKDTIIKVRP